MKNNSKSWAEVTTTSKLKNSANDWPDLSKLHKSNITKNEECAIVATGSFSDSMNNLTNSMERMNTNNVEQKYEKIQTTKSKDEIRDERKLRRKAKKIEKDEKRFQEKLAAIREPKTQKVKVIDKVVMDTYLANQTVGSSKHRQIKSKIHSPVKVNLLDLINNQVVKPIDRSFIQNRQSKTLTNSSTQRHKGKKSEFEKKKYLSKLKRSIILSRQLRNQLKSNADQCLVEKDTEVPTIPTVHSETEHRTETLASVQIGETTTDRPSEITPPPSSLKFSRKFRPYCDNFTTPELLTLTETLLRDIFRFQDRAYNKNEIKARSQKRYVVGFKETMRQLDIGKVKLLIIAPDLEQSSEDGGITETINEMKTKCKNSNVPYLFSLKRRQLGYVLLKKVPVSCVGILNYQGSEDSSKKLLQLIEDEKVRFQSVVTEASDNK